MNQPVAKKSVYFLILLLFSPVFSFGTPMNIGILTEFKITSLLVSSHYGAYYLYGDGKRLMEVKGTMSITFHVAGDYVQVKQGAAVVGQYKTIKMAGKDAPNSFNIKPLAPEKPLRIYDHNLDITVKNKVFRLINRVNIDYYVAGVVEAENGIKQNFEYYKMKSIICRTYALSNLKRHEAEGYSLCDQVHCQVYKAKNRMNDEIISAAKASTSMVIVDSDLKLITAVFHSNCGGQTLNSEDVWQLPTTYLKSIKDTFCLKQPHAVWEQKIPVNNWLTYLKKNNDLIDSTHADCFLRYDQRERETNYVIHNVSIPLKVIRNDFKLKSTFFIFEKDNDNIILKGKGFGHGIGLCQEGAMKMADLGFKFHEILHFYYKDVHLVDLSVLDFFKTE
jgi:stage II sporulation protein D